MHFSRVIREVLPLLSKDEKRNATGRSLQLITMFTFAFITGFLTAVQQNHARREGVSVDSLTFDFRILTTINDTEESLGNIKQDINVREAAFKVSYYNISQTWDKLTC